MIGQKWSEGSETDVRNDERRQFLATVLAWVGLRALGAEAAQREEPRYPAAGPGHFIQETREHGRYLVLEDKSLWEIAEPNRHATAEWKALDGISVRFANGDPPFAYELSNLDRDEGAAARWVRPER